MMADKSNSRPGWPRLMLVLLPVWLLASGGAALWYYFHLEKQEALVEQTRFAQVVSIPMLEDDLKKIIQVIGERNTSSEAARANLSRTTAMIEGLLGPSNTGYPIQKRPGPSEWPIIQVTVKGTSEKSPPVWVATTYDSRAGSPGAEANATGLAATLAAAQALAGDKPAAAIHFVFLPHANDPESPLLETAEVFRQLTKSEDNPKALLVVESMGGGESLWLSSRETSAIPLNLITGIGAVHGAEDICLADDADLASMLFEMDLPAVRVSTRPHVAENELDDKIPLALTVAASSGRLVELIRRCAK